MTEYNFLTSLIAGGVAGLVVDIVLFPIDTIKTRLQSEQGFIRSGGFKSIYKGLAPVVAGSAPTAALFFCTYESIKAHISESLPNYKQSPYLHMFAASCGEIVACSIRVPVEIAKQRSQVLVSGVGNGKLAKTNSSPIQILWSAYKTEGIRNGIYRGYFTTLLREIPFSFIQFPLWEYFKLNWCAYTGFKELTPWSVAFCGAIAGGISAGITTPIDVAKTRIMLSERQEILITDNSNKRGDRLKVRKILLKIYQEKGIKGLFAGFVPRVIWITIGGAFFFGFYDLTRRLLGEEDR